MSIRSFILVVAVFWSGLATANAEEMEKLKLLA